MFEQKYCMGTSDGKSRILWDISKILSAIEQLDIPISYVDVNELSDMNSFIGNKEYAITTDTNKPCIIVVFTGKGQLLIDGNHRLYKAKIIKQKALPCYILPEEFHKKYIVDYNEQQYDDVINEYFLK